MRGGSDVAIRSLSWLTSRLRLKIGKWLVPGWGLRYRPSDIMQLWLSPRKTHNDSSSTIGVSVILGLAAIYLLQAFERALLACG